MRAWWALALGALLSTLEARADVMGPNGEPPTPHTRYGTRAPPVDTGLPVPRSKVTIAAPASRWELVTLVALGAACTVGALAFAVVARRRRRDP